MCCTSTRTLLPAITALLLSCNCHALNLHDVVRDTITSNPDVLIAASARNSAEQQMEQARSGFFPQADITLGTGWESSENPTTRAAGDGTRELSRDEAEVSVRQLLYDGSGTLSEFRRQRARVNSRAHETFGTAEVTALRAIEAYLDVINTRMLERLATDNLESHQQTYDRIVKRGNRGVSSKADIEQSLGRLALARTNLMAQENQRRDAEATFRRVVGYDPAGLEEPASRRHLLPTSIDDAIDIALSNNPRLRSADAEIEAAREQNAAARALFHPRVHLELRGSNNENVDGTEGTNEDLEVMLRGRYSFTGGRDTARRKQTVHELEQARQGMNRTRRQVIEGVQLAWNEYETARSQLEHFRIYVEASSKALSAFHKQFNIGQRTLIDLLDQENEVFQASINYANAEKNLLFTEYRVLAETGKLLWAFEISLPEQATTIQ